MHELTDTQTVARSIAFMILNGSLDDDVVIPYLDEIVRAGYTGVCLHPRDGMLVPYLSRAYWQRLDRIVELCCKRDLNIWFYDEFPYPSGSMAGVIPELFPAARVRSLRFEEIDPVVTKHGTVNLGSGPLLALLRYMPDKEGYWRNVHDVTVDTGRHFDTWVWGEWHNRYYTGAHNVREELHERASAERSVWLYAPQSPMDGDRLLAIWLDTAAGMKDWPGMPDVTLPEVTDLFLEKVYRPYADLARKHGLSNVPIFQDEVNFYAELPWNREIEVRLRPLWGDDLFVKLAAIYGPVVRDWERVRYQYRSACQDAIKSNWFTRVADYCRAHGLLMTGHLGGEETIAGHWQFLGNAFENLAAFDVPGYDLISSTTADDVNRCQATGAKLVQSAAWLAGRRAVMAEAFGAHGFHLDLQTARTELAWLALHGIHHVIDHSTYLSALGPRKYDAPPVYNRFSPQAACQKDLWEWHRWFCDLLEEYSFVPETLVLFPEESFARYQYSEEGYWRQETSLLETFYHYVCAQSLDILFVPCSALAEVKTGEGGFYFRGQFFRNFIVPPVKSLPQSAWDLLADLTPASGFSWVVPPGTSQTHADEPGTYQIVVFNENDGTSKEKRIAATTLVALGESDLVQQKADAFAAFNKSDLDFISSDDSIVKSLRVHPTKEDENLLILLNANHRHLTVHFSRWPGGSIPQPPNQNILPVQKQGDGFVLQLPPRGVAIFLMSPAHEHHAAKALDVVEGIAPRELLPLTSTLEFQGPNLHRLESGEMTLDAEPTSAGRIPDERYPLRPFEPQPISSSWKLQVPYNARENTPYAPPYSTAPLKNTLALTVHFELEIESALPELSLLIDEDSLPPVCQVRWDDILLSQHTRDVFDQRNWLFPVPAANLSPGKHLVEFRAEVSNAAQGILERPILIGGFLVQSSEPLILKAMPDDSDHQTAVTASWADMGVHHGCGPVMYSFGFELNDGEASRNWQVQLPDCNGVTEVAVNNEFAGRLAWPPRLLRIPHGVLRGGDNVVTVRLWGTWNNALSTLNPRQQGLCGIVKLIR